MKKIKIKVSKFNAVKELSHSKNSIISTLLKNKDTYCWFELKDGNNIIIPTGEIIFKPKIGVDYKSILSKLNLENKIELKSINEYNYIIVSSKDINSIFDIANKIYESGLVQFSHPNFWIPIELNTNDALYNQQFYLRNTGQTGGVNGIDINVEPAWCLTTGNNIRVAVIDDGVEAHEDIAGRVVNGFTPRNNTGLGAPNISGRHGQACAGIIGATQNNTIGVSGVAPNCIIVPINIFFDGLETTGDLANAINWAWNQGQADVLSNSWGYNTSSQTQPGFDVIINAINNARTLGRSGKGCPVVFASGNAIPYTNVTFPANVSNVITVGSIDKSGNIWNYSCRSSEMDLVAPSGNVNNTGDVVTTDRMGNNGYTTTNYTTTFGGTSAACPQVAGVCALMLGANTNLTETQVRTKLQQTATDMGSAGFDNTFGYGRVNAINAVQSAFNMSINGSNSICNGSQTYSLVGLPTGATVIWSRTPTNTTTLVQSNNIATLTKLGDGLVTITATISICNGTITATKNINVGFPTTLWDVNGCQYPEAVIAEDFEGSPCNTQCYTPSDNKWWCAQPVYNATNVTWQKMWSIPSTYNFWSGSWSGNSNNVSIMFKSPNQTVVLKTTISNTCGSIEQYYCFSSTNILCSGNFRTADCKQYEVILIKNTSRLSIHEKSEKCEGTNKSQINLIQIIDKVGNVVSEQKINDKQQVYEIDLSTVKNDIYFVLLQYDNYVETHQIGIFK